MVNGKAPTLIPNFALRDAIEEWLQVNYKTVPRRDIIIGKIIGTGSFKVVYEGTFHGVKVAISKMRHSGAVATEVCTSYHILICLSCCRVGFSCTVLSAYDIFLVAAVLK